MTVAPHYMHRQTSYNLTSRLLLTSDFVTMLKEERNMYCNRIIFIATLWEEFLNWAVFKSHD